MVHRTKKQKEFPPSYRFLFSFHLPRSFLPQKESSCFLTGWGERSWESVSNRSSFSRQTSSPSSFNISYSLSFFVFRKFSSLVVRPSHLLHQERDPICASFLPLSSSFTLSSSLPSSLHILHGLCHHRLILIGPTRAISSQSVVPIASVARGELSWKPVCVLPPFPRLPLVKNPSGLPNCVAMTNRWSPHE